MRIHWESRWSFRNSRYTCWSHTSSRSTFNINQCDAVCSAVLETLMNVISYCAVFSAAARTYTFCIINTVWHSMVYISVLRAQPVTETALSAFLLHPCPPSNPQSIPAVERGPTGCWRPLQVKPSASSGFFQGIQFASAVALPRKPLLFPPCSVGLVHAACTQLDRYAYQGEKFTFCCCCFGGHFLAVSLNSGVLSLLLPQAVYSD